MSSVHTLTDHEFGLIRGMVAHRPSLTNQAILAYISRPGRDINHRVIGAIRGGWTRPGVRVASAADVNGFMAAIERLWRYSPMFLSGPLSLCRRRLLLDWWPVGQGLFASGAIAGGPGAPLNWVYDCGTSSRDTLLVSALDAFQSRQDSISATSIRLCVVSHFDRDHISGIVRLLDRFPVRTLLLPYVPLWRRLLIALEQGVGADDEFFDFFINPASWLAARSGRGIGEIIFVPSSGLDGPLPAAPEEGGGDLDDRELDLKPEEGGPPQDAAGDPVLEQPVTGPQVRFLRPGGRLIAPLVWEFVPYNDAALAPKVPRIFSSAAAPLIGQLRDDRSKRALALKALKALYDREFGSSAKARNLISLFLYSGPLGSQMALGGGWGAGPPPGAVDFSQIHTGDGTLDEGVRYDAFERFYGAGRRLERTQIFQVMHHGAKGNSHAGVAAKIAPDVSIFSSNPGDGRYNHPHAEVLRDFWPWGAKQVDCEQGYALERGLMI